MALTPYQRDVCRLIAEQRIASGESYVAGGVALNELLAGSRVSRDVDLFHDTEAALDASWQADRLLFEQHGFLVEPLRERPSFVEAEVSRGDQTVLLQWVRDSAYRFFPLVEHAVFGLTLHPFDLATNKVLALVGRLEVRDWIDVIQCNDYLQPLGYLAWAERILDSAPRPSWSKPREAVITRLKKWRLSPLQGRRRTPHRCPGAGTKFWASPKHWLRSYRTKNPASVFSIAKAAFSPETSSC